MIAVRNGLPADVLADFAELVFAYIDELSAAAVAGHTDETETTGRVRQRLLERISVLLLDGPPPRRSPRPPRVRAGRRPPPSRP